MSEKNECDERVGQGGCAEERNTMAGSLLGQIQVLSDRLHNYWRLPAGRSWGKTNGQGFCKLFFNGNLHHNSRDLDG